MSLAAGVTILVACLAIFVFVLIAILVGCVIKKRFLDPKGVSRSANSSAAIPASEGSEVQENLMRHQQPHKNAYYEYQQQQQYKTTDYSTSSAGNNCSATPQYNNNRNSGNNGNGHLSKMDPLPPPPPPPSESSSKYHQFPENNFQNQFQGQFQNQYEVPHVITGGGGGSGRYAPPPSLYGGSSVVQQSPIYPYRSQQYGDYYD